jgi:Flp pilus assembly protein protease CpaA
MRFGLWRRESPEEARQRRLLRKMLMLPPEPVYHHVLAGFATLGALGLGLVGVMAWRLGHLAAIAPMLVSILIVATLTLTVLQTRRRYRHVLAGGLVLVVLLGALAVAHRYGSIASVAIVAGPTPSALANSDTPR